MQIAAGGGVKLLLDNAGDAEPEDPLARLSWAVLCVIADTAIGRASLKVSTFFTPRHAHIPPTTN